jgi:Asp-tRNA(Asn)/Glu-tRNA(Gln) amidotransferase A subunit family amidase
MMQSDDSLTISETHRLFVSKQISPVELLKFTFEKLQILQPEINAFSTQTYALAMNSAKNAEKMFLKGTIKSKLQGIPISIKDNIDIANIPTSFGSKLQNKIPANDSPVVARIKNSGACIVGKTTMTEFGCTASSNSPLTGITSNPRNLQSTSGGSSAGAAASVASGITPIGVCTDGGGSSRIPAAFCGVFGFKPSFGRVPIAPKPALGDLFHVGLISRNVEDIRCTLDAISGMHPLDKSSYLTNRKPILYNFKDTKKPIKIGFFWSLSKISPDLKIKKSINYFMDELLKIGCEISIEENPFFDLYDIFEPIFLSRVANKISQHDGYQQLLDTEILEELKRCKFYTDNHQKIIAIKRQELIKSCLNLFNRFDFLACPTVPFVPFSKYETRPPGSHMYGILEWPSNCILANLTGFPAISIPSDQTKDGLPVGFQLIAPPFEDASILHFTEQIYQSFSNQFCKS